MGRGQLIAEARERVGLTRKQLAAEVGCTQQHLGAIEIGKSAGSVTLLARIGERLDIDLVASESRNTLNPSIVSENGTLSAAADHVEVPVAMHLDPSCGLEPGDTLSFSTNENALPGDYVLVSTTDKERVEVMLYRLIDGSPWLWPISALQMPRRAEGVIIMAVADELRRPLGPKKKSS